MLAGHIPELVIVLAIALIFLGPKRLPDAGKSLGKAIRGFRDETSGLRDDFSSIKQEAQGVHGEVMGMKDTVKSTVSDAVTLPPTSQPVAGVEPHA